MIFRFSRSLSGFALTVMVLWALPFVAASSKPLYPVGGEPQAARQAWCVAMCSAEFPPFVDGQFAGVIAAGAHLSCQIGCHGELPDADTDRLIGDCHNGNAEAATTIVDPDARWSAAACTRGAELRLGAIMAAAAAAPVEASNSEPTHTRNVPANELCRTEHRTFVQDSAVKGTVYVDRGFRTCEPGEAPGTVKVIDRGSEAPG